MIAAYLFKLHKGWTDHTDELQHRFDADQEVRGYKQFQPIPDWQPDTNAIRKTDTDNQEWFRNTYDKLGYPKLSTDGPDIAMKVHTMAQHMDLDPAYQEKVYKDMHSAYKENPAEIRPDHLAYLSDRVNMKKYGKQHFGTQLDGKLTGDIDTVNKRRNKFWLGDLEDYVSGDWLENTPLPNWAQEARNRNK